MVAGRKDGGKWARKKRREGQNPQQGTIRQFLFKNCTLKDVDSGVNENGKRMAEKDEDLFVDEMVEIDASEERDMLTGNGLAKEKRGAQFLFKKRRLDTTCRNKKTNLVIGKEVNKLTNYFNFCGGNSRGSL